MITLLPAVIVTLFVLGPIIYKYDFIGGPPHAPTRIFTLVLSETIQGQFDPTEYMIIKVPNNQTLRKTYCHDYCNPNSSLVLKPNLSINSTIEQQCNKITEMLRFVPHPVMELNQHVKLNEVFIFMNNEVSLSELLQFGFVVGESIPVERVSFVQVFGKWGHNNSISSNSSGSSTTTTTTLEPEMAKAIIMENNLLNYTATDVSVSATDVL